MTFEHARAETAFKPWGSHELKPWSMAGEQDGAVGELRYNRIETHAPAPSLLLKLLFTKQTLSIQVHPDDAFAQSLGMANGKTEAWYVLSAEDGAQVGIGPTRVLTRSELRAAIADGSISDLIRWRDAFAGDVFFIPAGTIHAIGAGLVIAEIQQRSDATFRLFDHGRLRELHIEQAVAAADLDLSQADDIPLHLTVERTQLVSCPFFMFERIDLPPTTNWLLHAERETWALVVAGSARIGTVQAKVGDVFFAEAEQIVIQAGAMGVTALLAYAGASPVSGLLCDLDDPDADHAGRTPAKTNIHQERQAGLQFQSTEVRA
jgi:mannose-6-phosphate isomerase